MLWSKFSLLSPKLLIKADLIFSSSPDVSAEGQLVFGHLVLRQQVVELVHRQVDDVLDEVKQQRTNLAEINCCDHLGLPHIQIILFDWVWDS